MFLIMLLFTMWGGSVADRHCKDTLEVFAAKAPYILDVEVIEVGKRPQLWAGDWNFNYQEVKYRVRKAIKGKDIADEITVHHALVKGAPNADKTAPGLNREMFSVGKRLLIFVNKTNIDAVRGEPNRDDFVGIDAYCNVRSGADEKLDRVIQTIES